MTQPPGPAWPGAMPPRVRPPALPNTLQVATIMLFVVSGCGILWGLLIGLLGVLFHSIARGIAEAPSFGETVGKIPYDAILGFFIGIGAGLILLGLVVVLLGIKVRQGRGWARIVVSAMLAMGAAGVIATVFVDFIGFDIGLLAVGLLVTVTPLVLLWLPDSTGYLRRSAAG